MTHLILVVAIVFEVIATSALKATEGFTRLGPSVVTIVGYGLAFYFLSLTLKTMPVGIVYAVWSGAGVVLIAAIGWVYDRAVHRLAGAARHRLDPRGRARGEPVPSKSIEH